MALDIERRIGNEILRKIRSLRLPLELDEITEGRGNCFPLAILAQCRRPGIYKHLNGSIKVLVYKNDPTGLRQQVHRFMVSSTHPRIQEYKRRYEEVISVIDKRNWNEYWVLMIRNYEWADHIFIQSTAWFLGFDIIIMTTTSTESNPYITITGNLTDENLACPGLRLILGSKSQVRFQSLLPLRGRVEQNELRAGSPKDSIKMKLSIIGNSGQKRNLMEGIKSAKSEKFIESHPDLGSLDEFPELKHTKVPKEPQPKTATLQKKDSQEQPHCKNKDSQEQQHCKNEDSQEQQHYKKQGKTF